MKHEICKFLFVLTNRRVESKHDEGLLHLARTFFGLLKCPWTFVFIYYWVSTQFCLGLFVMLP